MSFRILIADDEPLIRRDLKELIEEIGYEVVGEAKNGLEALALATRTKPDVIILDIKMPHMNGIEVARHIGEHFPLIVLTAYSKPDLVQQARDAGVMAYLTKPFRRADISPALELAVTHFVRQTKLTENVARLDTQLKARKKIEKAKGLLMKKENLSEAAAYRQIQKMSMDKNLSILKVAETIISQIG
jgi:two-component system, response regulator PdtaR